MAKKYGIWEEGAASQHFLSYQSELTKNIWNINLFFTYSNRQDIFRTLKLADTAHSWTNSGTLVSVSVPIHNITCDLKAKCMTTLLNHSTQFHSKVSLQRLTMETASDRKFMSNCHKNLVLNLLGLQTLYSWRLRGNWLLLSRRGVTAKHFFKYRIHFSSPCLFFMKVFILFTGRTRSRVHSVKYPCLRCINLSIYSYSSMKTSPT